MDLILVIIAYIYILLCFFVFANGLSFFEDWRMKLEINSLMKINNILKEQLVSLHEKKELNPKHTKKLYNKLLDPNNLCHFHYIVQRLSSSNKNEMDLFFKEFAPEYLKLAKIYSTKEDELKALFAYSVSELKLGENQYITDKKTSIQFAQLRNIVNNFLLNGSLYLQENTIKAIVSFNSTENIISMLNSLNEHKIEVNAKLLSDNLLKFPGDMQELADALVEHLTEFSPSITCGIIDMLRYIPQQGNYEKWNKTLLKVMDNNTENKDVYISVLRYYKKYPSETIYKILITIMNNHNVIPWEYVAVVASTLSAYKRDETIEVLKKTLQTPNWHVRYNSATSLISLGQSSSSISQTINDKYAKEVMLFCENKQSHMKSYALS